MGRRYLDLFAVSLVLGVHNFIVGHYLPSSIFVASFCWGWVGFAALAGRIEAVKSMAATMVALLLFTTLILKFTPLGHGNMYAFYTLALLPSLVAWCCTYLYSIYILHCESNPSASFEEALNSLSATKVNPDWGSGSKAAAEFAARMTEDAVGRGHPAGKVGGAEVAADPVPLIAIPRFTVSRVA